MYSLNETISRNVWVWAIKVILEHFNVSYDNCNYLQWTFQMILVVSFDSIRSDCSRKFSSIESKYKTLPPQFGLICDDSYHIAHVMYCLKLKRQAV